MEPTKGHVMVTLIIRQKDSINILLMAYYTVLPLETVPDSVSSFHSTRKSNSLWLCCIVVQERERLDSDRV